MDPRLGKTTSSTDTRNVAKAVDALVRNAQDIKKPFTRRWYDNQWFDDGFHYRFVSRTTGKIVDLAENGNIYNPYRAIPKASKQIRGIINTLLQNQYMPIVYPKRLIPDNYNNPQEYEMAKKATKTEAKKQGLWLQYMWQQQEMKQLVAQLFIIAAKQATSWLKVWPNRELERINVEIVDNWDMYYEGYKHSKADLNFMVEEHPKAIVDIWANEEFDESQKLKINPDNKYSSDQVKESYMRAKYGLNVPTDFNKTVLLREAYLKEHLDDDNRERISAQKDGKKILDGKKDGDIVIRQIYTAGSDLWLSDKYIAFDDFPYIPLQLEPGPFLQTPLIERFIQVNKSIDTIVSRVERYTNTMVAGAWQRRKGENHTPTNLAGGVVYEYEQSPLQQLNISPVPNYVFNFINLLNSFIAEQGMVMAGTNLPKGKQSAQAIEAIKAMEVNQLKMTDDQLKLFINRWAEMMLDLAHDYFVKPQEVVMIEQGEPTYFDIIGGGAYEKLQEVEATGLIDNNLDRYTPIKKDLTVEIKSEAGLGYTPEAKKAASVQLSQIMEGYAQQGLIPPQAMQKFISNLLEQFGFGNTQEVMELVTDPSNQQVPPQMLDQIKLAVAQVMADIMKAQQGGGEQPSPQGQNTGQPPVAGTGPQPMPNKPPQPNPNAATNTGLNPTNTGLQRPV